MRSEGNLYVVCAAQLEGHRQVTADNCKTQFEVFQWDSILKL
jgi:hypothetical protein